MHGNLPLMFSCRGLTGLVVLLLAVLAACSRAPQLPRLSDDAAILAFGDSLTYGTGAPREYSYPAVLEALTGRRVINAGVPGEVTAEGLERLADVLDEYAPQLLILCLGGNDMLRRVDEQRIASNLEQMVAMSRARGVPVLLLGVPRPALMGMESASFYEEIAARWQVPLEAEIIPEVLAERRLKSDAIHPNAEGYRRIANAVHAKLKKTGAL